MYRVMQDMVDIARVFRTTVRQGITGFMFNEWQPFKVEFDVHFNVSGFGDYTWRIVPVDCDPYWEACLQQALWYEMPSYRKETVTHGIEVTQRVVIGTDWMCDPEQRPDAYFFLFGEGDYPNATATRLYAGIGDCGRCSNDIFMGDICLE